MVLSKLLIPMEGLRKGFGLSAWTQEICQVFKNNQWKAVGIVALTYVVYKILTRTKNLPPGPFNFPLFGSLSYMTLDLDEKLLEMRALYGEVIYLNLFGTPTVFLNSEEAIKEAFIKQGVEFANRKPSALCKAVNFHDELLFEPYNNQCKAAIKMTSGAFRRFGSRNSGKTIRDNWDKLEKVFKMKQGQAFYPLNDFKTYVTAVLFQQLFNKEVNLNDPELFEFLHISEAWFEAFSTGMLIWDIVLPSWPILQNLFGRNSRDLFDKAKHNMFNMLQKNIKEHRDNLNASEIKDIVDYHLVHRGHIDDNLIAGNLTSLMAEGIDSFLAWMCFFLSQNQDDLRTVQTEIDAVSGEQGWIPSLKDKAKCPYTEAVIYETLRLSNLIPLLPPRVLSKDVKIKGFTIPKHCTVVANVSSVHFDPTYFPNPREFDPTRFLAQDGQLDKSQVSRVMVLGLGLRVCAGEFDVKNQLFITLALLVQKFHMTFCGFDEHHAKANGAQSQLKQPPSHTLKLSLRN